MSSENATITLLNNEGQTTLHKLNIDQIIIKNTTTPGSTNNLFEIYDSKDERKVYITPTGLIHSEGEIQGASFNALSDKRLKENIILFSSDKSILDLSVYKYDYINGAKNNIGCIAQELQDICPELVSEDSTGYLSIKESKLVYLLIEEVKKLNKRITDLEKR
jgi:hypothetical protein